MISESAGTTLAGGPAQAKSAEPSRANHVRLEAGRATPDTASLLHTRVRPLMHTIERRVRPLTLKATPEASVRGRDGLRELIRGRVRNGGEFLSGGQAAKPRS